MVALWWWEGITLVSLQCSSPTSLKNSISVLWYSLNVHLYPHDGLRHNPANAYLKSGSLSVTASIAPTAECGEWSALSRSCKLITRTISMEFESRSKRLMRAMTSFRSRMSWGLGLLSASHPSSWNKIFSEVAIPARTIRLILQSPYFSGQIKINAAKYSSALLYSKRSPGRLLTLCDHIQTAS